MDGSASVTRYETMKMFEMIEIFLDTVATFVKNTVVRHEGLARAL
ncbi:hypothetical protein OQ252_08785 [Acetobacter farinalis]|uniref:Uncharacterized protein n=1 Tax=Acetobacter farinalis TaxID=1260984 RepID=A0ABT3Q869_9PROT|nr:hypothetical protein [Acetobacter farinalis]MCX2561487.1 hypothetical protein [Acetobacter farinalis]